MVCSVQFGHLNNDRPLASMVDVSQGIIMCNGAGKWICRALREKVVDGECVVAKICIGLRH